MPGHRGRTARADARPGAGAVRRPVTGGGRERGTLPDLARHGGGGRRAARACGEGEGRDPGRPGSDVVHGRRPGNDGPRDQRRGRAAPVGGPRRVRGRQHLPRHARRGRWLHRRAGGRHRGRPRPDRRRRARRADARHPGPGPPVHPRGPRPRACRHRDRRPGEGARFRHHRGRPDQPHRDPRPDAGRTGRRRRLRSRSSVAEGTTVVLDGGAGTVDIAPNDASGAGRREAHGCPAGRQARVERRGRHVRRPPDPAAGQRRRPEERAGRGGCGRGGRGPVPHRVPVPRLREGADGRRAGGGLRGRLRGLPRRQEGRGPHARRGRGQAAGLPGPGRGAQPRARRAGRPGGVRGSRGSWTASCRPSPAPRSAARPTCG